PPSGSCKPLGASLSTTTDQIDKSNEMEKINLIREVRELKTHLYYSKNIGFFFGAGTSCALKIPNVEQLTIGVETELKDENKANFIAIKEDLKTIITDRNVNIEDILNHIRRIREITGEVNTKSYQGISGESAKNLDIEICKIIYQIIAARSEEHTSELQS